MLNSCDSHTHLFPAKMRATAIDGKCEKFQCSGMSRKSVLDGKNGRRDYKVKGDN